MDDHMDYIVCRGCERPTCEPPDELMEFKGLCPSCVIKQEVLPIIPGRFAELIDSILENRDDAIMEKMIERITGGKGGNHVAIVVDVSHEGGSEAMADKVFEVFKHIILHDKEARAKLKDIIEHIDTCPDHNHDDMERIGGKIKKPVVRNDPRTS